MENQNKLSRRRFMKIAALGAGGIFVLASLNSRTIYEHIFSNAGDKNFDLKWRFLTNQEAILIDAIADQIIPPDEWPGGREVGVTNFIDKQLVGPYARFQTDYRKGLQAIQDSCELQYHKKFEALSLNEQTLFLETIEAGNMKGEAWKDGFDRRFFNMLRDHSMQGYYGSSRHGGNKNNVSYKMLELDYPLIIGQNRYQS